MISVFSSRRPAAAVLAAATAFAIPAQAQDFGGPDGDDDGGNWDIFIGVGVEYEPEYEGSDKYKTTGFPGFQAVWRDRLLISGQGIGAFVIREERLRVSAAVGYGGGRKESDSSYLHGLGDIDDGAVLSFAAQYDISRRFAATADVSKYLDGSKGTLVTLGLQSQVPFGVVRGALLPTGTPFDEVSNPRGLALIGGISVDWADSNYNQSFFGVSSAQSAASGLSQYTAGSGFKSVNVDLGFAKPLGENWGLTGAVTYSKILGSAADSPLVKDTDSVSATLAIGYNF